MPTKTKRSSLSISKETTETISTPPPNRDKHDDDGGCRCCGILDCFNKKIEINGDKNVINEEQCATLGINK